MAKKYAWKARMMALCEKQTGVLLSGESDILSGVSDDFGHLTRGECAALAQPSSGHEVKSLLRFACENTLSITVRGAGMSQSGQSVGTAGSLVMSTSALNVVGEVDETRATISCGAGARWGDLVFKAIDKGFIPYVSPLNLDMSVGGLLSVGGIGATSHFHGPLINHVEELEVVTGSGELVACDAQTKPDLFDATLAGLGRVAVMTNATIRLRRFKPKVKSFYLLYDDLATCMQDQQKIISQKRGDYLEVFCSASVQGLRKTDKGRAPFAKWFYPLQLSFEYSDVPPSAEQALEGLSFWQKVYEEESDTREYVTRYQARFDMMRDAGSWEMVHPWFECILPAEKVVALLPEILDEIPMWLGDGYRIFHVAKPYSTSSSFKVPDANEVIAFAILPMGVPEHFKEKTLEALTRIHHKLINAGGKRYTSGWLGMMDDAAWAGHFGKDYERWIALKKEYDPSSVLVSALFD